MNGYQYPNLQLNNHAMHISVVMYVDQQQNLLRMVTIYIISSETSAKKSSSNTGCSVKSLCVTQFYQPVCYAQSPGLEGKGKHEINLPSFRFS